MTIDYKYLETLNERLIKIEQTIVKVFEFYKSQLLNQLNDNDNPLDDFELSVKIYGLINENDVEEHKEDDIILYCSTQYLSNGLGYIGGECIHNEIGINPEELNVFKHCWLFHDMIDHNRLSLEDCCRIKDFWFDFQIQHQATLNVETNQWWKNLWEK
jgi:hypothetical protein